MSEVTRLAMCVSVCGLRVESGVAAKSASSDQQREEVQVWIYATYVAD